MSKVQSIVNKHSVEPQTVKVNISIKVYTGVVKRDFGNNCAFLLGKGFEERLKELQFCGLQTKQWILILLEWHSHYIGALL